MTSGAGAVTRASAWRAVALLCGLYAVSFLDRMVLALVMDPVRASLRVSDAEIGLLFGMGFVFVYVLAGFPLAQLIDTGKRKRILIAGVLCWSCATFLSAFATSYIMLAAFRSGVAVGEAVLLPAAMSLISDLFPKNERAFPTTIYTLTGVIGGAGVLILGSGALKLAEMLSPSIGAEAWRIMFAIVAIPGPILAVLIAWLVPEPERSAKAGGDTADLRDFLRHLRSHIGLYLPMFIGTGCVFTVAVGMNAWGPTLLAREHGMEHTSSGLFFGIFSVIGAIIGIAAVTGLIRWLGGKSRAHGVVGAAIVVSLTVLPILAILIGSTQRALVLAGVAIGMCGAIATGTFSPILMQSATPAHFLGRMSAIYLLFNNILGMGMGPLLVAALATRRGAAGGIGAALTTLAWAAIAISSICYLVAFWHLSRRRLASGEHID
jgi:MFS family permease